MDVRNCIRCGKMFRPVGGRRICPDCVKADLEEFHSVRDYLKENPRANILEVNEATGVSIKKLRDYIREGRLVLAEGNDWGIKCENCGEPVKTGRLCPDCTEKFEKELRRKSASNWGDRRLGEKMRVYRDKFRRW